MFVRLNAADDRPLSSDTNDPTVQQIDYTRHTDIVYVTDLEEHFRFAVEQNNASLLPRVASQVTLLHSQPDTCSRTRHRT